MHQLYKMTLTSEGITKLEFGLESKFCNSLFKLEKMAIKQKN